MLNRVRAFIVAVAISSMAHADDNAAMVDEILRAYRGVESLEKATTLKPLGSVAPVTNAQGAWLGSAIHVCLDRASYETLRAAHVEPRQDPFPASALDRLPAKRSFWITPEHVVGDVYQPKVGALATQVEVRDASRDFMLVSTPPSSRPCRVLAQELRLGRVFDIDSAFGAKRESLDLERAESSRESSRVEQPSFITSSLGEGLPGRDNTGALLFVQGHGKLGHSGGVVAIELNSQLLAPLERQALKKLSRIELPALAGMILAVDESGQRIAALPAPTIYKTIVTRLMSGRAILPRTHKVVEGGTLYREHGVTHYRNLRAETALAHLTDAGTGSLNDGGTGSLNDGGHRERTQGGHSAGLFRDGKLWLSLDHRWAEFEAVPEGLLALPHWSGVYQDASGIWSTEPNRGFANWLPTSDPRGHDALFFDGTHVERDLIRKRLGQNLPCFSVLGALRKVGASSSRAIDMAYCEYREAGRSVLYIATQPSRTGDPAFSMKVEAKTDKACAAGPCAVSLRADYFQGFTPRLVADPFKEAQLPHLVSFFGSLRDAKGQQLVAQGLRSFTSPDLSALLTREGGFRFHFAHNGEKFLISGPMTQSIVAGVGKRSAIWERSSLKATSPLRDKAPYSSWARE